MSYKESLVSTAWARLISATAHTNGTVIQENGRMQSKIMQKWMKAEAHQSLVLCYCICIVLQPCSSNIWAYEAVWWLSGILFLWKCNSKLQGACAKWRNSVVPACVAKQGISERSLMYFPSISPVSLPCDLRRGPFLEYPCHLSSAV